MVCFLVFENPTACINFRPINVSGVDARGEVREACAVHTIRRIGAESRPLAREAGEPVTLHRGF